MITFLGIFLLQIAPFYPRICFFPYSLYSSSGNWTFGKIFFIFRVKEDFCFIIITRNRKLVWKNGPNWPFYSLMLRIKVFLETILLYLASKCKQTKGQTDQKSGQQRLFMDPYFYFFMWLLSVFFFFILSRWKQNWIKLCYNRLQFVNETQISTASNRAESQNT